MALPQTGGMLPNGNFIPKKWSTIMLAKFIAENVVPRIANHDYEGEINGSGPGNTVEIRLRPDVDVFDYTIGQTLQKQKQLLDQLVELSIDYGKYFNVPINDLQKLWADIDYQGVVQDQGSKAMGKAVEQHVLRTIWTAAGSTVPATAIDKTNIITQFAKAALKLREKDVPEEDRWAVVDPVTAYCLGLSDLSRADVVGATGGGYQNDTLTSGQIRGQVQGFKIYMSTNLQWSESGAKVLCGHKSALTFAGAITKSRVIDDRDDFGVLLQSLISYGFKVLHPESLVTLDLTFAAI